MSGSHRQKPWWSWLLTLASVVGLVVFAAPAYASPPAPAPAPAPPADPLATVAQVGPQIVNIDTELGYQSAVGAGTGIVIDPNGVVLTNNHVIAGATQITARSISTGQAYPVQVIGYDRTEDIAVVQLGGAAGLPVANIGDSNTVRVGDPIVSLGNAGGAGGTPSAVAGRVVALNQTVSASDSLTGSTETLDGLIQVDAGIRPGDSGGPTVNAANQVIGVNTAASENYHLGRGQGFVIPINQAMAIAGQIRSGAGGPTVHIGPTGFLGVGVTDANGAGAAIQRVVVDGPAARAGISPGDVITSINGAPVNSATALTNLMDQHYPGDTIAVGLASGAVANVTLAEGPPG
ncbi:S1C family serine protease [Mycobacterium shimoidei]|uniref:Putative serine protease PepA (Serine proteinase) (MTB32A) [Mycobacterium tuberculosis H37Rv] n=1 Tax=Mycobacterium shimoidei TaxID=29313 RepID=A0A1E3TM34_MYCSH|nr:trypsin-like peptidase domain-containing protein [Mycobacterium shimoidei]MCV7258673.1 trypsin-like peptidase domain-containing protein [Mycobacterium shimoidei]ODR15402.1 serine protease [Mycobacterium shimoidei]ORW79978.1 serine protease [Mycobacterium shimoidei]SRX92734.1 putative serine protease PepA (serine proteinase) (MTB32A) [Mycobacterium tuberculosis H37Rv] [Mycobacterium shimoidei]